MSLFIHFFKFFKCGMRIDLGSRNALVTQKFFYRAQLCFIIQHCGSKSMPQHVRTPFLQRCKFSPLDNLSPVSASPLEYSIGLILYTGSWLTTNLLSLAIHTSNSEP